MPSITAFNPDPLQKRRDGEGYSLGGVDPATVGAQMQAALAGGVDVPGRVQDGPTCGLYALGMVMDSFAAKDPRALDPLVQSSDRGRAGSHTETPNTSAFLLDTAEKDGFTTQGEMFYADQLASLAQQFGYKTSVDTSLTLGDLKACIARGHPALVAFDVDHEGNPGLYNGGRAHWCVVEGTFQKDGEDYVVATHGWEGKEYVWRAQDLLASAAQLNTPDFPGAPRNLQDTLAHRMVEIYR